MYVEASQLASQPASKHLPMRIFPLEATKVVKAQSGVILQLFLGTSSAVAAAVATATTIQIAILQTITFLVQPGQRLVTRNCHSIYYL